MQPIMRGVRGLNVCRLAADDCGLHYKFIYECMETYMVDLVIPMLSREQPAIIPALGLLRVVRYKQTNCYSFALGEVVRLPARKRVVFKTSKLAFDLINSIDGRKNRYKKFIHLSDIEYIAVKIKSSVYSVYCALRAWMDAAILFVKEFGRVHLPAFGLLRMGELNDAKWARDIHNGRNIVMPECYRLKIIMRKEVDLLIKNKLN